MVAVHFRKNSHEIPFSKVKEKFEDDLKGARKTMRPGFIFFTNCDLPFSERVTLENLATAAGCTLCSIYHLERVHALLDSARGFGPRSQYLGIKMTTAERTSYDEAVRLEDQEAFKKMLETAKAEIVAKVVSEMETRIARAVADALASGGKAQP